MTKEQQALATTIGLLAKMQSVIHSIDELEDSSFQRELKYETNKVLKPLVRYQNFLERRLQPFYDNVENKENDTFNDLVIQLDEVCKDITVD